MKPAIPQDRRLWTTREIDAAWHLWPLEYKKKVLKFRRTCVSKMLTETLRPGVKIRATRATCGAREATFTFSHWEGSWIVSKSGAYISPSQVYSVAAAVIWAPIPGAPEPPK